MSFMPDGNEFSLIDHLDMFVKAGKEMKECRQFLSLANESLLAEILSSFDDRKARAARRAVDGKCSNWLNVVPIADFHFDLSEQRELLLVDIHYIRLF